MGKRTLLLKHEQGHFDLAEEATRKTRIKIINHFQNKVFNIKKMRAMQKKEAVL